MSYKIKEVRRWRIYGLLLAISAKIWQGQVIAASVRQHICYRYIIASKAVKFCSCLLCWSEHDLYLALRKNLCKNNQLQKNDFVLRAAPTVHKNQYPQLAISFEDRFAAWRLMRALPKPWNKAILPWGLSAFGISGEDEEKQQHFCHFFSPFYSAACVGSLLSVALFGCIFCMVRILAIIAFTRFDFQNLLLRKSPSPNLCKPPK